MARIHTCIVLGDVLAGRTMEHVSCNVCVRVQRQNPPLSVERLIYERVDRSSRSP